RLPGTHPNEVGIVLGDGDVADRHEALTLEQRLERRAVVDGLPHSTVGGADVENRGVRLIHGQIRDAARHRGGADGSEVERVERAAARHRGGRLAEEADAELTGERENEDHDERKETDRFHGNTLNRWQKHQSVSDTERYCAVDGRGGW